MGVQYHCSECGVEIKKGEFMAIVGDAPAAGLSAPIGRADKLFDKVGRIYCGDCFATLGTYKMIGRVQDTSDKQMDTKES